MSDRTAFEETVLSRHLRAHGAEAEHLILDEIYCLLHEKAGELEGNTEEKDAEWLARQMYVDIHPGRDFEAEADQELWTRVARSAISLMPHLCRRQASRMRAVAQTCNTILAGYRVADERRGPRAVAEDETAYKPHPTPRPIGGRQ